MKNIIIEYKDLLSGDITTEMWEEVEYKGKTAYKTPQGRYMTKGLIGWFDITDVWD